MKILKFLLMLALLLAAVLFGGGALLPRGYTLERSVLVAAPPDRVYPLVAEPRRWKDWSAWNQRDPAMRIEYLGPVSGVGASWNWQSTSEGNGSMTLTAADAPRRVAFDLVFPDFDSRSTGELRFAPEAGGTRVTWVMQGDMGANPMWRWMGLFMDRLVGPDFETGLARLKTLAESGG